MTSEPSENDKAIELAFADLPDEFSFFRDVYAREIQPDLSAREFERLKAVGSSKNFTYIGIAVGLLVGVLGFFATRHPIMLALGGFGGFSLHQIGQQHIKKMSREAKALIMDEVTRALKLDYVMTPQQPSASGFMSRIGPSMSAKDRARMKALMQSKRGARAIKIIDGITNSVAQDHTGIGPAVLPAFRQLGLIPSWDRARFEDLLTGEREGVPFEFFEARLEQRRQSTDSEGRTRTEYVKSV